MDNNLAVNDLKQYIITKFDNEQYGINISYIENIVRVQPITRVPHVQPYFLGIINLRGEIIPIMSLRLKFDLDERANTNETRILIIKCEQGAKIGILVDSVKEVVSLSENDIEKISSDNEAKVFLSGVGKYNNSLISLINIQGLINEIENE